MCRSLRLLQLTADQSRTPPAVQLCLDVSLQFRKHPDFPAVVADAGSAPSSARSAGGTVPPARTLYNQRPTSSDPSLPAMEASLPEWLLTGTVVVRLNATSVERNTEPTIFVLLKYIQAVI